jgi:hypothetical protein
LCQYLLELRDQRRDGILERRNWFLRSRFAKEWNLTRWAFFRGIGNWVYLPTAWANRQVEDVALRPKIFIDGVELHGAGICKILVPEGEEKQLEEAHQSIGGLAGQVVAGGQPRNDRADSKQDIGYASVPDSPGRRSGWLEKGIWIILIYCNLDRFIQRRVALLGNVSSLFLAEELVFGTCVHVGELFALTERLLRLSCMGSCLLLQSQLGFCLVA